ncbi:unnamed protein product [Amoebophrya sp. A120]|nr:unnamed protein product [Amoebophrya sp. A120]|eukprot:GSA120T00015013001.1
MSPRKTARTVPLHAALFRRLHYFNDISFFIRNGFFLIYLSLLIAFLLAGFSRVGWARVVRDFRISTNFHVDPRLSYTGVKWNKDMQCFGPCYDMLSLISRVVFQVGVHLGLILVALYVWMWIRIVERKATWRQEVQLPLKHLRWLFFLAFFLLFLGTTRRLDNEEYAAFRTYGYENNYDAPSAGPAAAYGTTDSEGKMQKLAATPGGGNKVAKLEEDTSSDVALDPGEAAGAPPRALNASQLSPPDDEDDVGHMDHNARTADENESAATSTALYAFRELLLQPDVLYFQEKPPEEGGHGYRQLRFTAPITIQRQRDPATGRVLFEYIIGRDVWTNVAHDLRVEPEWRNWRQREMWGMWQFPGTKRTSQHLARVFFFAQVVFFLLIQVLSDALIVHEVSSAEKPGDEGGIINLTAAPAPPMEVDLMQPSSTTTRPSSTTTNDTAKHEVEQEVQESECRNNMKEKDVDDIGRGRSWSRTTTSVTSATTAASSAPPAPGRSCLFVKRLLPSVEARETLRRVLLGDPRRSSRCTTTLVWMLLLAQLVGSAFVGEWHGRVVVEEVAEAAEDPGSGQPHTPQIRTHMTQTVATILLSLCEWSVLLLFTGKITAWTRGGHASEKSSETATRTRNCAQPPEALTKSFANNYGLAVFYEPPQHLERDESFSWTQRYFRRTNAQETQWHSFLVRNFTLLGRALSSSSPENNFEFIFNGESRDVDVRAAGSEEASASVDEQVKHRVSTVEHAKHTSQRTDVFKDIKCGPENINGQSRCTPRTSTHRAARQHQVGPVPNKIENKEEHDREQPSDNACSLLRGRSMTMSLSSSFIDVQQTTEQQESILQPVPPGAGSSSKAALRGRACDFMPMRFLLPVGSTPKFFDPLRVPLETLSMGLSSTRGFARPAELSELRVVNDAKVFGIENEEQVECKNSLTAAPFHDQYASTSLGEMVMDKPLPTSSTSSPTDLLVEVDGRRACILPIFGSADLFEILATTGCFLIFFYCVQTAIFYYQRDNTYKTYPYSIVFLTRTGTFYPNDMLFQLNTHVFCVISSLIMVLFVFELMPLGSLQGLAGDNEDAANNCPQHDEGQGAGILIHHEAQPEKIKTHHYQTDEEMKAVEHDQYQTNEGSEVLTSSPSCPGLLGEVDLIAAQKDESRHEDGHGHHDQAKRRTATTAAGRPLLTTCSSPTHESEAKIEEGALGPGVPSEDTKKNDHPGYHCDSTTASMAHIEPLQGRSLASFFRYPVQYLGHEQQRSRRATLLCPDTELFRENKDDNRWSRYRFKAHLYGARFWMAAGLFFCPTGCSLSGFLLVHNLTCATALLLGVAFVVLCTMFYQIYLLGPKTRIWRLRRRILQSPEREIVRLSEWCLRPTLARDESRGRKTVRDLFQQPEQDKVSATEAAGGLVRRTLPPLPINYNAAGRSKSPGPEEEEDRNHVAHDKRDKAARSDDVSSASVASAGAAWFLTPLQNRSRSLLGNEMTQGLKTETTIEIDHLRNKNQEERSIPGAGAPVVLYNTLTAHVNTKASPTLGQVGRCIGSVVCVFSVVAFAVLARRSGQMAFERSWQRDLFSVIEYIIIFGTNLFLLVCTSEFLTHLRLGILMD